MAKTRGLSCPGFAGVEVLEFGVFERASLASIGQTLLAPSMAGAELFPIIF